MGKRYGEGGRGWESLIEEGGMAERVGGREGRDGEQREEWIGGGGEGGIGWERGIVETREG